MADEVEKRIRRYCRRDRGGGIIEVKAVDLTRENTGAFVVGDLCPDRRCYSYSLPCVVLVRRVRGPADDPGWSRWQAGRTHHDGIHWEDRLWPRSDFVAFRDHVARLVETKPTRLELLEERHAMAKTLIEDTSQEQTPLDPDSKEHADLEWVIGAFTDVAEEFQEDIKDLKAATAFSIARLRGFENPAGSAANRASVLTGVSSANRARSAQHVAPDRIGQRLQQRLVCGCCERFHQTPPPRPIKRVTTV